MLVVLTAYRNQEAEVAVSHCILGTPKCPNPPPDVLTGPMTTEYRRRPRPSRADPLSHVIAWRRRRTTAGVTENCRGHANASRGPRRVRVIVSLKNLKLSLTKIMCTSVFQNTK